MPLNDKIALVTLLVTVLACIGTWLALPSVRERVHGSGRLIAIVFIVLTVTVVFWMIERGDSRRGAGVRPPEQSLQTVGAAPVSAAPSSIVDSPLNPKAGGRPSPRDPTQPLPNRVESTAPLLAAIHQGDTPKGTPPNVHEEAAHDEPIAAQTEPVKTHETRDMDGVRIELVSCRRSGGVICSLVVTALERDVRFNVYTGWNGFNSTITDGSGKVWPATGVLIGGRRGRAADLARNVPVRGRLEFDKAEVVDTQLPLVEICISLGCGKTAQFRNVVLDAGRAAAEAPLAPVGSLEQAIRGDVRESEGLRLKLTGCRRSGGVTCTFVVTATEGDVQFNIYTGWNGLDSRLIDTFGYEWFASAASVGGINGAALKLVRGVPVRGQIEFGSAQIAADQLRLVEFRIGLSGETVQFRNVLLSR